MKWYSFLVTCFGFSREEIWYSMYLSIIEFWDHFIVNPSLVLFFPRPCKSGELCALGTTTPPPPPPSPPFFFSFKYFHFLGAGILSVSLISLKIFGFSKFVVTFYHLLFRQPCDFSFFVFPCLRDLSFNSITGQIPDSLFSMNSLSIL